jgi:hypothetical protein
MEAETILPQSILGRFSIFDSIFSEFFVPPTGVIRNMDEIVDGEENKTYRLKDATSFFAEAMKYMLAQMVVEKWIDQGDNVFMVVGCRISSNGRIDPLEVHQVGHKWVERDDVIQSGLTEQYVSWKAFDQVRGDPVMAIGVKLETSKSIKPWGTMERGRIKEKDYCGRAIREEDIGILL